MKKVQMQTETSQRAEGQTKSVGFLEAFWFWVKLGFINFGGPAGQIAIMHRELVEKKRWISEGQYLRTLNFCMLLPGPEAQQVATYIGWRLHGTLGGIVAGSFFVIPSIFVLWLLSYLAVAHSDVPAITGLLYGIQPVVIAIVVEAVLRIGKRTINHRVLVGFAVLAFMALYFLSVPFPLVVLAAAVAGLVLSRTSFAGAAFLTFGGAYSVLSYVADVAVNHYGWLTADQMVQGLGLAESTPGPLIMVTQYVGFIGAWNDPGPFAPLLYGTLGALITTYATFLPCFLFIFFLAPYIELLANDRRLKAILVGVTAAVVGVVANLAVYFATQVLFPDGFSWGGLDVFALVVAAVSFVVLQRYKVPIYLMVPAGAVLGMAWTLL